MLLSVCLVKVLWLLNFVKDGIVDAATGDQRVKSDPEQLQSVSSRHNAVVRGLVMSKLLLQSQVSVELETVFVFVVIDIEVFVTFEELIDLLNSCTLAFFQRLGVDGGTFDHQIETLLLLFVVLFIRCVLTTVFSLDEVTQVLGQLASSV